MGRVSLGIFVQSLLSSTQVLQWQMVETYFVLSLSLALSGSV